MQVSMLESAILFHDIISEKARYQLCVGNINYICGYNYYGHLRVSNIHKLIIHLQIQHIYSQLNFIQEDVLYLCVIPLWHVIEPEHPGSSPTDRTTPASLHDESAASASSP